MNSQFFRRRLFEASAAFLAAGVMIGCVVSSFGQTPKRAAYGLAALWVMIAFWRICRLNDQEREAGVVQEGRVVKGGTNARPTGPIPPAPKPQRPLLTDKELSGPELEEVQKQFHAKVVADYELGGRPYPCKMPGDYLLCRCGADCNWFGLSTGEPCWGQVNKLEEDPAGNEVHACAGHRETLDYWGCLTGEARCYIPQPSIERRQDEE